MLPPSFGLALLLTTLVALGPLSTDLYLPALPGMTVTFATDVARVQLTLSVFLIGYAVAQLFYGPVSDRYGRRPAMLFGLVLYLLSSVACMLAPSVDALIAARFFQALGACAGPVLGRTIVRDVYGPVQAARVLAYISGAMAIAPMLGPVLGGWLTEWFGWRANFALLALYAAVQTAVVFRLLGESNAHKDPAATRPRRVLDNFRMLLAGESYPGYLLCVSFGYGALFSFISGSSFVLVGLYGLSQKLPDLPAWMAQRIAEHFPNSSALATGTPSARRLNSSPGARTLCAPSRTVASASSVMTTPGSSNRRTAICCACC